MAQVTLDKAIALLSSERLKERSDSLADLKHILQQTKTSSKLTSLNDKACHKIFESLFRFISVEKSLYNKASSKGASGSRLSACASVIRTAVDVFLRNLRTKSIRAIVDHITEILQVPGEGLWEHLSADYLKCLTTLLHYPPHVEHLGANEWEKVLNFCLTSVGAEGEGNSQPNVRDSHSSILDDYVGVSPRSTSRRTSTLALREKQSGDKRAAGEAIVCIQLLVATPIAPVQAFAEKVLQGLTAFLKSSSIAGSEHQAAFSSINTVVMRVLFGQSDLVRNFLLELIPVIRHLWSTKLGGLKDELLVTVMLCVIVLTDATRREPTESLSLLTENLLDTLYSEYIRRPEKDILQIDELIFHRETSSQTHDLTLQPRLEVSRSEHNWTVVWIMAKLMKLSEELTKRLSPSTGAVPSKKQRFTSAYDEVFKDAVMSSGNKRVCALQLIPILLQDHVDMESKASLLQRLIPCIIDDNNIISSWTMVAIASIASDTDAAASLSLKKYWQQTWNLTSRASTSQNTSRAACNLMGSILQFDLLEYSVVAETTASMLASMNLNAPSIISDASLGLWATLTRLGAQTSPGSASSASKQICSWLREAWTIGTVADRVQTAQIAAFARPLDLLNLFLACTNRQCKLPKLQYRGPGGLVAKGWHFYRSNQELLEYLFHINGLLGPTSTHEKNQPLTLQFASRQDPNDDIILDMLQAKADIFLQTWRLLSENKTHHVTVDIFQILSSFCIVVAMYTECLPEQNTSRIENLHKNCQQLWENLCSFMASREVTYTQSCLELLCPLLAQDCGLGRKDSVIANSLYKLTPPLTKVLETYRQDQKQLLSCPDQESMELDDPLMQSHDLLAENMCIINLNREHRPPFQDSATFQRSMTIRLSLFQLGFACTPFSETSATGPLIEYLTNLDEADLLSARHFLPHIYQACSVMDRSCLLDLLEDMGEKCLQTYQLERCENSQILCIRVLSSFVKAWTNGVGDHLTDSASDIYNWFTDVLLAKGRASSQVLIAFSRLLKEIFGVNATYTSGHSSPSPRTSLFTILRESDILTKFNVGNLIPLLFGHFPLKNHDAIFDDVLDSLPRDPDWDEGIALRLLILAKIASQWHTLLRRSIYHMFETPAQVPHSLWYAEKCVRDVATILGLEDARQLFRLFSSQILYTWTETQSITSMPFSIFGYPTIEDMLVDVQDEIVGQIMMRANEHEADELSSRMGTPFVELLATSFHKAEAYSIARDISTPPGQGSQPKGVENRLKKILGADRFVDLIEKQFPQVIATFFGSLDQYEQIERAFAKRPNFQAALNVLKSITAKSFSKAMLPANQQPSFRARYLLDELDFLCRRSGYELDTIWTPTLATYVCRTLLESIHPALGSLHACSIIRKIRILMCIAGPVMLRDYPCEMLLHGLRPFLTDIYCAEDALGLFWYLLEAGRPYLIDNPGFTAGISVSTLLYLRKFLTSFPAGTMQESQTTSSLANIRRFLDWFEDFLSNYESNNLSGEGQALFQRLVDSSRKISATGNESDGMDERDLLLEVIRDRNSKTNLLSHSISDHILSLLCTDFKSLPSYQYDYIGEGDDAIANSVALCQTLQDFNPTTEYRLWAAQVIGRVFAATGRISDVLTREQSSTLFEPQMVRLHLDVFCQSKARILQILCNMLQKSNPLEVGLVERTLQLIISTLAVSPEFESYGDTIPPSWLKALIWSPYQCPSIALRASEVRKHDALVGWTTGMSAERWARSIGLFLSRAASKDPVIGPLITILHVIPHLAAQILPYILHDVLLTELEGEAGVRQTISEIFRQGLHEVDDSSIPHVRLILNCILYLRNQPRPQEATIVERDEWLDIDFAQASKAAKICRLPKTSLLFLEIQASRVVSGSRRSSLAKYEPPPEILHEIFRNVDDPDLFYGVQQSSSLESVMGTLEHESSGLKNLLFQSAQYDSAIQMSEDTNANASGLLRALNSTNLQGIANSLSSYVGGTKGSSVSFESMMQAAINLRQWDIPVSPLNLSPSAALFRAFQSLNSSRTLLEVSSSVKESLLAISDSLASTSRSAMSLRTAMRDLGIVTEISDMLSAKSSEEINEVWKEVAQRNTWLKTTRQVEVIHYILNCHEALFSSIKRKRYLKSAIGLSDQEAQLLEVQVIRQSLEITRSHGIPQASLKSAVCLSKLANSCAMQGINIEGAAKFDLANVLWDQGEMAASIRMLQQLDSQNDIHKQAIPISRPELLVTLGHHVAEARLEKPEAIIQGYLAPAVKELKNRSGGGEAGRVYHGFAIFCDQQLQNPDGLEDFKRVEQLRNRKEKEVLALEDMMKRAEGKERDALRHYRTKTKQWFDLDDREYQRLRRSREAFLQQCLENYLLCLKESDNYNADALRFCAIWLDKSDSDIANKAVSKYLNQVPSRKFAPLMNQLTSRLLDTSDEFQNMLFALIFRICVEHPFHGMYQIFASSKSKGGKDQSALSRNRAANKLVDYLRNDKRIGPTWVTVHNANINYVRFAVERLDEKVKSGAKVQLKKFLTGQRLEQDASTQRLPPPTMKIEIRLDCDYSDVPKLVRYHPEFTVASGVSAPKIVTAVASDGHKYKQLFKGGNDDLRQDAIMEQVFEQVSSLLKDHQATQQRKLGIRTYKVLPLTSNAGIIEFVPHTIPLHDYLMPAHQKYFPKDMKPSVCRKHISDVQTRSFEQRVKTFRQVTEHFHPVMRYFFMEKFNNPDDWFSKRLAYTRSTAAISILGHVLGLGDRHGHNILLDERTGEVVHIDLGVAFEQGRVLPVPEVVPFRLTRDLVDGMGITKTEGVFRRCCEFTLEALRQESYSIMTILDVLRYDPLYSWTVSPLRMKRMQDAQEAGDGPPMIPGGAEDQRSANEPSEADRALTVVAKKLSKTLSVTATVNELIQQATDERNLAVLYCGMYLLLAVIQ
ncbi:DNA-binding protein kinase TEL1 [Aspergillus clavatus NRRL 1]|uniref:Serine/threonine-protein kinase Tel1 n=1 Tax=Aspergillus clavatus (strain ATCC 1007 / CBS 513.65 / DSM 816 / NCTC 3887 / NRRL 1 / QM 1276 / 107) TaxID=344612 RepID=A1CBL0_ASPCL|nr:ataxia telangiectasia mutated (atm) [Aspergillus clavatus NRRL 1]EAW13128.1 ataxia telangiectasia mutated (atm) [Aspergillus clavatus NRRL 1]